ncbi:MAG: aspartate aminotransferase family protein [Clostridiales bacterium]|nr:aspartate aminotransferase family protein [Clostridiales bacterium]
MDNSRIFEEYESNVRSYCRNFPAVFKKAKGSTIIDENGNEYLDFFNGAGALNYGHNNDYIKSRLVDYLMSDGLMHGLDMMTVPKAELIDTVENKLLKPRGLDYKIMFPGPTGTNAVEAALKLARKYTKRRTVWALMGAFHGMTLGALALTSDEGSRGGAGVPLENVVHIPAPYMFDNFDTIEYMETLLSDDHSAVEKPAAFILETVQAEGGVYVLSVEYLKAVRDFCTKHGIILIVDDIQVGNARTGTFFSFERAGIVPDMVVLSKSIGGYGFPFALTLFRPEYDVFTPGEHNGTFRGNQMAMVASKAGIEFNLENNVEKMARDSGEIIEKYLKENLGHLGFEIRGIGCIWGIDMKKSELSQAVVNYCFAHNLILERAGRDNGVVKLMPALTVTKEELLKGLEIVKNGVLEVADKK